MDCGVMVPIFIYGAGPGGVLLEFRTVHFAQYAGMWMYTGVSTEYVEEV